MLKVQKGQGEKLREMTNTQLLELPEMIKYSESTKKSQILISTISKIGPLINSSTDSDCLKVLRRQRELVMKKCTSRRLSKLSIKLLLMLKACLFGCSQFFQVTSDSILFRVECFLTLCMKMAICQFALQLQLVRPSLHCLQYSKL